jgi:hypothetical protein
MWSTKLNSRKQVTLTQERVKFLSLAFKVLKIKFYFKTRISLILFISGIFPRIMLASAPEKFDSFDIIEFHLIGYFAVY